MIQWCHRVSQRAILIEETLEQIDSVESGGDADIEKSACVYEDLGETLLSIDHRVLQQVATAAVRVGTGIDQQSYQIRINS